eukprot:592825-Heterocapsa_arctica.AAC.1
MNSGWREAVFPRAAELLRPRSESLGTHLRTTYAAGPSSTTAPSSRDMRQEQKATQKHSTSSGRGT